MTDDAAEAWVQAPIKSYRGHVLPDGTVAVSVEGGAEPRFLKPRNEAVGFAWGKKGNTPGESQLAFALLDDALGNELEATAVYGRFKRRVIGMLGLGSPWSLTHQYVLDVVGDIRKIERETSGMRAAMAQQQVPAGPPGLPFAVQVSPKDQGVDRGIDDPATAQARASALAKLSPEERKALGV